MSAAFAATAVIRIKEKRPEAADYGRSNLRNQRRIDFLRSTADYNDDEGHATDIALLSALFEHIANDQWQGTTKSTRNPKAQTGASAINPNRK